MVISDSKISRLFDYLSSINKDAYKNEFLLANDVLAKTPPIVNMLEAYFFEHEVKKATFPFVAKRLFFFYIKNLVWIFSQFAKKIIFLFSGQKFPMGNLDDKVVFIDTCLLVDRIVKENHYKDSYFPGLTDILDKRGVRYVYVPKIVNAKNWLNFYKMLRVLKREKTPILTEYQLLDAGDFLQLLRFVVCYPFYVVRLILSLGDKVEDSLAKFALYTFSGLSSETYFRLLYGEKLSRLTISKIKCISWYENQASDKCFYRGLRKHPGEVFIYGAQLFIWPPSHLNLHVDEREIEFGIVPDKVLVNGNYFLRKKSKVDFQIGPALRYRKVFQSQMTPSMREDILVLFPYWEYEISNIWNCLKGLPFRGAIKVKFHPSTDVRKYMELICGNICIVEGDVYSHFKQVRMVIGSATGALVEAASLGIPVINIVNKTQFPHMYLPDIGKGVLWDTAATNAELLELIAKFDYALKNEEVKLVESAIKIKEMFFCEPTEEKIIEAFDIV